jgi:hypothetical protein
MSTQTKALTDAMTANAVRQLDISLQILQLKEERELLYLQWNDLSKDLKDQSEEVWIEYIYFGKELGDAYGQWEASYPEWQISGNNVRRRKRKPTKP